MAKLAIAPHLAPPELADHLALMVSARAVTQLYSLTQSSANPLLCLFPAKQGDSSCGELLEQLGR